MHHRCYLEDLAESQTQKCCQRERIEKTVRGTLHCQTNTGRVTLILTWQHLSSHQHLSSLNNNDCFSTP
ncbi:hypothetical protein AAFF_G00160060 [Aldrovandia affinis]|uniref:Uncharacterized protein n=1 Tax=Aldrovandia affinis TaxID=143900 RepID=A0AAD7W8V4_9TELE|nr:hypothetical protein AAFF_G00160060 [Aldrovandia affinis]